MFLINEDCSQDRNESVLNSNSNLIILKLQVVDKGNEYFGDSGEKNILISDGNENWIMKQSDELVEDSTRTKRGGSSYPVSRLFPWWVASLQKGGNICF